MGCLFGCLVRVVIRRHKGKAVVESVAPQVLPHAGRSDLCCGSIEVEEPVQRHQALRVGFVLAEDLFHALCADALGGGPARQKVRRAVVHAQAALCVGEPPIDVRQRGRCPRCQPRWVFRCSRRHEQVHRPGVGLVLRTHRHTHTRVHAQLCQRPRVSYGQQLIGAHEQPRLVLRHLRLQRNLVP